MFYRELMDRVDDQARELIALRARVAELEKGNDFAADAMRVVERRRDELKRLTEELRKTEDIQSATIRDLRARVAEAETLLRDFITHVDIQDDVWINFNRQAKAWLLGAIPSAGTSP